MWQAWQCVAEGPSGSGGEGIQELQLYCLSIHSPRVGALSTFLGQFKARAGEICMGLKAFPTLYPQAAAQTFQGSLH